MYYIKISNHNKGRLNFKIPDEIEIKAIESGYELSTASKECGIGVEPLRRRYMRLKNNYGVKCNCDSKRCNIACLRNKIISSKHWYIDKGLSTLIQMKYIILNGKNDKNHNQIIK